MEEGKFNDSKLSFRPQLFKSWIALSTGEIARIRITKTNCVIHWIVIYLMDSAIHLLNNWGQIYNNIIVCKC